MTPATSLSLLVLTTLENDYSDIERTAFYPGHLEAASVASEDFVEDAISKK